jgi:hypothetical protein
MFTDYLVAAKVSNDNILGSLVPNVWNNADHKNWFVRMMLSFPTVLISLGLTIFVPDYATMIGFVSGITNFGVNFWGPALCWFISSREKYTANSCVMTGALLVSIPITIWVVAASLYEIVTADFTSEGFFCGTT